MAHKLRHPKSEVLKSLREDLNKTIVVVNNHGETIQELVQKVNEIVSTHLIQLAIIEVFREKLGIKREDLEEIVIQTITESLTKKSDKKCK